MAFVFLGFSQTNGLRHFVFQRIAPDRTRSSFTVTVELLVAQRVGIRVQELPLLCRRMLDASPEETEARHLTLTEEQLRLSAEPTEKPKQRSSHKRPAAPVARVGQSFFAGSR